MIPKDIDIRKTTILLLYQQAKEDDFVHPFEMKYIFKVVNELGFDNEVLKEVNQNPLPFEFKLPEEEHSRMQILYHLLFLTKFDQEVSDREVNFLKGLGLRLGLRDDFIQDMTDVMKQHIGQIVPPGALLNVIRKYLN